MIGTDTDAQILAAVAAGDTEALGPLIARHHVALHRFVARRIGADAEDIVSETFECACLRAASYRAQGPDARPWLFGIATNLLRGHARREAAMYKAYARTGIDPAAASAEDSAHVDSGHGPALARALAQMRDEHREALLLYALADLSYEEVALALDVPVGTVKGWLHRARSVATRHLAAAGVVTEPLETEISS
jgi:RNA polymerase sigma-70 factor (ECF subfamily)